MEVRSVDWRGREEGASVLAYFIPAKPIYIELNLSEKRTRCGTKVRTENNKADGGSERQREADMHGGEIEKSFAVVNSVAMATI